MLHSTRGGRKPPFARQGKGHSFGLGGEQHMVSRVLIIGGGIGGLSTAIGFCRKGFDVSVFESAPELNPVGKGIWMPTNAMLALDRLGLAADVLAAGWPLESIQLRTASGSLLSNLDLDRVKARFGFTTVPILRASLVQTLAAALPAGVLQYGKRFSRFAQDAGRVRVLFDDGTEEVCDILVGADGIHSMVRGQLFGPVQLRYSGQTCYRGVANYVLPPEFARLGCETWGGDCRFGFSPVAPGKVYWFAPIACPAGAEDFRIEESYRNFPHPIPQLIAATNPEEIIRTDLTDFSPIPTWHSGPVVLLGDAAHAMTPNLGQGGAQSIEDAVVLAQCVAAMSSERAFLRYEEVRRSKAVRMVNMAWTLGKIAHWRNPAAQTVRNLAMRCTPDWISARQTESLYALNY